jgi:hypothetical protein
MIPAEVTSSSGLAWSVATRCNGGACVRVARNGDAVLIGDSKNPVGPVLEFTLGEFKAFTEGVKQGEFDDLL